METVLGLSMTSSGVGWVLRDGLDADGATLDHDAFDVAADASDDGEISKHAAAAVRGARAIATASGHQVKSIGVTWTDDADGQAARLLKALPDLGFEEIVAVRLPEATRAWAQTFGHVLGFEKCAVCVVEPAAVTVLTVGYNTVRISVTQKRDSVDGLTRWLTDAFEQNRCKPESLFLVGSRGELELMSGSLEEALSMPVDASDEAQLALARGAALTLTTKTEVIPAQISEETVDDTPSRRRPRFGPHARAATVLVAGVMALFAVGPELAGHDEPRSTENRPAANSSPTSISSARSNSPATSASVRAVPAPVVSPAPAQVRPLAAPPPPPSPRPPAPPPSEALPARDEAVPSPEPEVGEAQVTATPVVAPVEAPPEPRAAQPVAAPSPPVAPQPAAPPPLPFVLLPWLAPPSPVTAQHAPAPAAQPAVAPPVPAAQPAVAPPPAAAQPALAPPAPAAPPPPGPSPAPPPPPPQDPVAAVLSPFFGALP